MCKWITFLFFAFLPLQTQYVFHIPVVQGAVWEFGIQRVYVVEIVLFALLVGYGLSGGWKLLSYYARDWLVAVVLLLGLWSLIPSEWTVSGLLMWVHASSLVGIGLLGYWTVQRFGARMVIFAFLAGMVASALYGAYQYSVQEMRANKWLGVSYHAPSLLGDSVVATQEGRTLRAYGPLPHPNIFGGYLVAGLLALVFLFPSLRSRGKQLALLCAALFCVVLVWTYSRSAWVAAALVLFAAYHQLYRAKIEIPKRAAIASMCIVFLAVVASWQQILPRVGIGYATHPLEQRSLDERVISWAQTLPILREHALLGTGIGRFTHALQTLDPGKPGYAYQPVHNSFLLLMSEVGIIGVLLLGMLLFAARRWYWPGSVYAAGLFVLLFFDHYLWSTVAGLLLLGFWLFFMHFGSSKNT